MIRLRALGTLDLQTDGNVTVRSVLAQPRRTALLAFLALAPAPGFRSKDTLYATFWPERDGDAARHALRQSVYFLRRSLGDGVIEARGRVELGLSRDRFWCDATAFQEAMAADRLEEALELYRGDLLEGFFVGDAPGFERWLDGERARLRELAGAAGWRLAEALEEAGDLSGAVRAARRAAALAPTDEVGLRRLLALLERAGDRAMAARLYGDFVANLRAEYDLEPSPETVQFIKALRVSPAAAPVGVPDGPQAEGGGRSGPAGVAVFPFTGSDGRLVAALSDALAQLLAADLRNTWLRPLQPRIVRAAAGGDGALSQPDVARGVAARLGAGRFILGSIVWAGDRLRAVATLYDAAGREVGLADAMVEGEERIFELSAELARQLLAEEWEVRSDVSRTARHETRSVAALHAFYEGDLHFQAARLGRAMDAFRRALVHDPELVSAWMRLAFAAAWSFDVELSEEAATRASALGDRLQEPDASLLRALLALLDGGVAQAEDRYRTLVSRYPENPEGWVGLGFLHLATNPYRGRSIAEAEPSFERAVALAPRHLNLLVPLAYLAARDRRYHEFHRMMGRLGPDQDFAPLMRVTSVFSTGDAAAREEQLAILATLPDVAIHEAVRYVAHLTPDLEGAARIARILTDPSRLPEVQATGHVLAANLELALDRPEIAAAELERAGRLDPDLALEQMALFSAFPFLSAADDRLQSLRDAIDRRLDAGPQPPPRPRGPFTLHDAIRTEVWTYLRGLLSVRLADREAALEAAHSLEMDPRLGAPGPLVRDLGRGVRSALAEADGDPVQALEILAGSELHRPLRDIMLQSPFYSGFLERYRRGRLLIDLGRPEEGRAWLDMITEFSVYGYVYVGAAALLPAGLPGPAHDRGS
jgi:DNA-binding SARP family transcriptional activator